MVQVPPGPKVGEGGPMVEAAATVEATAIAVAEEAVVARVDPPRQGDQGHALVWG